MPRVSMIQTGRNSSTQTWFLVTSTIFNHYYQLPSNIACTLENKHLYVIVEASMKRIAVWISVSVDDRTNETTIITSGDSHYYKATFKQLKGSPFVQ